MKTSFYFVLWILIYPIIGLINIQFSSEASFMMALVCIWGLSWLLKQAMPDTLNYEDVSQYTPVLEDIYTRNIPSFKRRLAREAWIETVAAIYFCVTAIVIVLAFFVPGEHDWIVLIVFGYFAYGSISRAVILMRAYSWLKENPTPEQCMEIADEVYRLDYTAYYNQRQCGTYESMFPPRPRHYNIFLWFSIVMAVIAAIFGLRFIFEGTSIMLANYDGRVLTVAFMNVLYGSLALYFGITDYISVSHSLQKKTQKRKMIS